MLNWLRKFLITEDDKDPAFARLLRNILIVVFVILVLLAVTQTGILSGAPTFDTLIILATIALLTGYFIYLANKNILWPGKLFLPTALLISLTYFIATANGLHDVAVIGFPSVIFIASLLLGRKSLPFWAAITSACIAFVGYWDIAGYTPEPIARTTGIDTVAIGILVVLASTGIAWLLLERFEEIIAFSRQNESEQIQANQELRELQASLQTRIEERTFELAKRGEELETANQQNQQRATQFEAIAQVANATASIRSLDELLPKITQLISEYFNFYHVGIFLTDTSNQYSTLSAANSEGGQRMLARGHRLKIGEQGIVGNVASTKQPRIALDVGEDATYFNNPDLPGTHSEMALPLMTGEKIIGVLDVQSRERSAFSEEDLSAMAILATQVSLAIENARTFEESSKSLVEAEALYRQFVRQAWGRMPREQKVSGYRYTVSGAKPIENDEAAPAEGKVKSESKPSDVSIPIMLRGESIGMLEIQVPNSAQVNSDQMDLIRAVADRVAISAENARLFEETTQRAERERLVSEITSKIRSTNDPQRMVQIALDELKTALGATKVQMIPHAPTQTEEFVANKDNEPIPQPDPVKKNGDNKR